MPYFSVTHTCSLYVCMHPVIVCMLCACRFACGAGGGEGKEFAYLVVASLEVIVYFHWYVNMQSFSLPLFIVPGCPRHCDALMTECFEKGNCERSRSLKILCSNLSFFSRQKKCMDRHFLLPRKHVVYEPDWWENSIS